MIRAPFPGVILSDYGIELGGVWPIEVWLTLDGSKEEINWLLEHCDLGNIIVSLGSLLVASFDSAYSLVSWAEPKQQASVAPIAGSGRGGFGERQLGARSGLPARQGTPHRSRIAPLSS